MKLPQKLNLSLVKFIIGIRRMEFFKDPLQNLQKFKMITYIR